MLDIYESTGDNPATYEVYFNKKHNWLAIRQTEGEGKTFSECVTEIVERMQLKGEENA